MSGLYCFFFKPASDPILEKLEKDKADLKSNFSKTYKDTENANKLKKRTLG